MPGGCQGLIHHHYPNLYMSLFDSSSFYTVSACSISMQMLQCIAINSILYLQVSNDMLSDDATRCVSTGSTYDPHGLGVQTNQPQSSDYCSRNSPLGCMLGDLSGRLGFLNIRSAPGTSGKSLEQKILDIVWD